MKVEVLQNQTDITKRDLGELQRRLAGKTEILKQFENEQEEARRKADGVRRDIDDLQSKIDGVVKGMKAVSPGGTKWADDRRLGRNDG